MAENATRKSTAKRAPASAKTPRPRKTTRAAKSTVGTEAASKESQADQRLRMVREAAYFKAERRGFCDGNPEQDWLEAEAEIDGRLGSEAPSSKRT